MKGVLIILFMIMLNFGYSQSYNKEIEARLKIVHQDDFLGITGLALNKTPVDASLRYELSVIKNNPNNKTSKDNEGERFTLKPDENKELSSTSLNLGTKDRVIVLLLIYDLDDNLVGKDRYVINDNKKTKAEAKKEIAESVQKQTEKPDGIVLRGIVTEDMKTKAGNDFYNYFYSNYSNSGLNSYKIIDVKELFNFGRSTKIQVMIEDKLIFQFFVQPKDDFLRGMASQAIRRVSAYLQQLERNAETIQKY